MIASFFVSLHSKSLLAEIAGDSGQKPFSNLSHTATYTSIGGWEQQHLEKEWTDSGEMGFPETPSQISDKNEGLFLSLRTA